MNNSQKPKPMYCPNCGNLNYGTENSSGKIRYKCKCCRLVMIRFPKGRRHDVVEIYDEEIG